MKRILYDKYEVLELIGCGGAGKVYLARDMHLERLVVIKESRNQSLIFRFICNGRTSRQGDII